MKIACVIYSNSEKYFELHQCATQSFRTFHPDIPLFSIDKNTPLPEGLDEGFHQLPAGVQKYVISLHVARQQGLDKLIILGADTITCSRLVEFIEGTEDILATLDYPYQFSITANGKLIQSPDDQTHVNADVVCFNNLEALAAIIKAAGGHSLYFEQGGLNEVLWTDDYNYSFRIIDYPYQESDVVYNTRAKGNICDTDGSKPWDKYTNQFFVEDGKLFTGADAKPKQIRVFHYCDGLFNSSDARSQGLITWWKEKGFNEVTKKFFVEQCNCDFFR